MKKPQKIAVLFKIAKYQNRACFAMLERIKALETALQELQQRELRLNERVTVGESYRRVYSEQIEALAKYQGPQFRLPQR